VKDRTIVAIALIAACAGLMYCGKNSALPSLLAVVAGFYFGREAHAEE